MFTEGELPSHVRARASFGPETCAQAANLTCGHHIPIWRAMIVLCQLADVTVSTGWMAGIRGEAAALVQASGFMEQVRKLLKTASAVHADETPARAATGTRYVHLACTAYLTHMHTGDRSAEAIDVGGVLPGYTGIIVRDGYGGYEHLTDALHAWCGAHLLRDLKSLYDFEPGRYQALAAAGLAANLYRRTATAKDARRFLTFKDLILASPPALAWISSPITKPSALSGRSKCSSAAQPACSSPRPPPGSARRDPVPHCRFVRSGSAAVTCARLARRPPPSASVWH